MAMPSPVRAAYHVGWICAVQTELVTASELFDTPYSPPRGVPISDSNSYTYGCIGEHNVVVACLPLGNYGLASAATVAKDMLRSFPNIRIGLMVGIGGGAPSKKHDIRLGDVVVSTPTGRTGGVIHYEYGKTIQNKQFERTGQLDRPPPILLNALHKIKTLHERQGHSITETVHNMIENNPRLRDRYLKPALETDVLYKSSFVHADSEKDCAEICRAEAHHVVKRSARDLSIDDPVVHYGLIASADRLMKDATVRDSLAETEEVLCFEMEAAGLMGRFPCVVIRGICDYSDTHKNDLWQGYAAAVAAAYAKELLSCIPAGQAEDRDFPFTTEAASSSTSADIFRDAVAPMLIDDPSADPFFHAGQTATLDLVLNRAPELIRVMSSSYYKSFRHYNYEATFKIQEKLCYGTTFEWVLQNKKFKQWAGSPRSCLLQVVGSCGVGKSTMSAYIVNALDTDISQDSQGTIVLYSIYDEHYNNNASAMFCILIHQLLSRIEKLQEKAYLIDSDKSLSRPKKRRPAVQLQWLLRKVLENERIKDLYIVIDGLDRCSRDEQKTVLAALYQFPCRTKSLLTSRTLEAVTIDMQTDFNFDILVKAIPLVIDQEPATLNALNEGIDDFTKHQLDNTMPFSLLPRAKRDLVYEHLRARHNSTFMVVHFYIETLRRKKLEAVPDIRHYLRLQAVDHGQLYVHFIDQLRERRSPYLRTILMYMLFSVEILTVRELAYICGKTTSTNTSRALRDVPDLLEECYPLIIKHPGSEKVDFWHPSVKEILLTRLAKLPVEDALSIRAIDCRQQMAIDCLSQLVESVDMDFMDQDRTRIGQGIKDSIKKHAGLWYALRHWYEHLSSVAQSVESPSDIMPELSACVKNMSKIWTLAKYFRFRHLMVLIGKVRNLDSKRVLYPFELYCALGLTVFVRQAMDKSSLKSSIEKFTFRIELALMLSVRGGHTKTVKMLIDCYNITSLDGEAYSGIVEDAAMQNQPELVELLLKMRKRDPKEMARAGAAAFATGNLETLNVLRREHAFQDRDEWGTTVLHSEFQHGKGIETGHGKLAPLIARIQLLIENEKVDVNAREGLFGNSALHLACWYKYPKDILEELVRLGADPKALNTFKWTPLHLASRYSVDPESVNFLLDTGGKQLAGMLTRGGNSALHWAAETKFIEASGTFFDIRTTVIRRLLQAGSDPHLKNARGESPMSIAGASAFSQGVVQNVYTRFDRMPALEAPPPPPVARIPDATITDGESDIDFASRRDKIWLTAESSESEYDGWAKVRPPPKYQQETPRTAPASPIQMAFPELPRAAPVQGNQANIRAWEYPSVPSQAKRPYPEEGQSSSSGRVSQGARFDEKPKDSGFLHRFKGYFPFSKNQ